MKIQCFAQYIFSNIEVSSFDQNIITTIVKNNCCNIEKDYSIFNMKQHNINWSKSIYSQFLIKWNGVTNSRNESHIYR